MNRYSHLLRLRISIINVGNAGEKGKKEHENVLCEITEWTGGEFKRTQSFDDFSTLHTTRYIRRT